MKETVIKCDRCGREYGLDQWPEVEFRGVSPTKIELFAVLEDKASEYVNINKADVDLCKECRASFRDWFSSGHVRLKDLMLGNK